jgi:hypothetical protein
LRRLKNRLKSLETARIALIVCSGLENPFENAKRLFLETPYGTPSPLLFIVCYVSNMAAIIQKRLSCAEFSGVTAQICTNLEKVLIETIRGLPLKNQGNLPLCRGD